MAGGPIKQMLEMKLNFIKVYLIILTVTKEFYWKNLLYSLFFGKCKGNYFFSSEKNKPREKKMNDSTGPNISCCGKSFIQ